MLVPSVFLPLPLSKRSNHATRKSSYSNAELLTAAMPGQSLPGGGSSPSSRLWSCCATPRPSKYSHNRTIVERSLSQIFSVVLAPEGELSWWRRKGGGS